VADFASLIEGAQIDWVEDGPWLALLLMLVSGIVLPALLYSLFDRWAARRLKVDTVALATRYGGFMNSWAVFGRHATEYRDLRPLFPNAQAAELARFEDGTATIAARFRSQQAAEQAAEQRFASFAAAGVEYADAGISFQTASRPGTYARGQWLVIGDSLFAFYAPNSALLAKRRRATPALRASRFPGPLRLLHSRAGHGVVVALWVVGHLIIAALMLERTAWQPGEGTPVAEDELRRRLTLLEQHRDRVRAVAVTDRDRFMLAGNPLDLRRGDFDQLAGRTWITGMTLDFDSGRNAVNALLLVGQVGEPPQAGAAPALPEYWRNNPFLIESDDPLLTAVRDTVLTGGWGWQPQVLPRLSLPEAWSSPER
jgi:hypothetical protein